jgi:capsular exopolysaccharide synthesis family protein
MDLRDYVRILRKQLVVIITAATLFALASLANSLLTTPVYQGTAKLLVVAKTNTADDTASAYQGALLSEQLVKSFAQIMESRATAEAALRVDPQPFSPRELQERVHAEPITDTLLITLGVEDTDPTRAKRMTNSVARAFILTVPKLQSGSALRVSLVEPALTPTEPVRPRTTKNVVIGLLIGLMLGTGFGFLRELLDRTVKTPEDLEAAAGAPVVGSIPPFKAAKQPLPVAGQPRTPVAEAFRKLRTNFSFLAVDRETLCCVVTSPEAGDGKSTVAANLAIAFAQAGERVVLVDADLRRPTLHRLFDLHQRVGTTTVLLDRASAHDAIQQVGPNLPAVLTSGQLPPNPSELLGSRRMADLLTELRSAYDVVLIDCAPLLPVTDPMAISQFADGLLLVARAGSTTKEGAHAAKAACAKAGARIFGAVLNATAVAEGNQSTYHAYYGKAPESNAILIRGQEQSLVMRSTTDAMRPPGRAARHRRVRSETR